MRIIRGASFEEFVRWYLAREGRKRKQNQDLTGRSWESLLAEMRHSEGGKLRPWFEGALWSIASFDTVAEAMSLVCVDNWQTRGSRLVTGVGSDNRLARTLVAAARETGYFDNHTLMKSNSVERHNRQERIDAFRRNWVPLQDDERLTVCDLNAAEKAESPGGTYYLHDGFGRLLAYLYLVVYEKQQYRPIEVFMCQEMQSQAT
jgi:hypothetical protein